ncbi:MAG: DNA primase, partial [Fibrobacter sp.]|nr:DNA primase [Fibrobacter sp.]
DTELRNQYVKLIAERFNTDRSLAQVKSIKPDRPKAPKTQPVEATEPPPPEISIPWHAIPPMEIRFANLLLRNPTLMDRAAEYFDVNFATSGIRMFESGIVEEFVSSAIALYLETGCCSPQLLYENFSPEQRLFLEGLPEEQWKPPQEIIEFYQTLTVLSTKLCDRQKKLVPLTNDQSMNMRLLMSKFTQGMTTLNNLYNNEKITIDAFADQIVKSKIQLIQFQAAIPNG